MNARAEDRRWLVVVSVITMAVLLVWPAVASAGINSWTSPASPPRGVSVRNLWNVPSGPFAGLIMAASQDGVFHSTDDGAGWHAEGTGLTSMWTAAFDVLASADGTLVATVSDGVYRLRGGETTWTALVTWPTSRTIRRLLQHDAVLVGGRLTGICLSSDGGATWTTATANVSGNVSTLASADSTLLAGGQSLGLWTSVDDGDTWVQNTGGIPITAGVSGIAVASNGDIWVAASPGLYRSVDGGGTWTKVDGVPGCADVVVEPGGAVCTAQLRGPIMRAATPGDAFTSIGGISDRTQRLAVSDSTLVAGFDTIGVFTASLPDAPVWRSGNAGLPALSIHRTHVTPSGVVLVGARSHGVGAGLFRSLDRGSTWAMVTEPSMVGYGVEDFAGAIDGRVAVASGNGVFETTNAVTWTRQGGDQPFTNSQAVAYSADGAVTVVGGWQRIAVFRSGDSTYTDLPITGLPAESCVAVALAADGSYLAAFYSGIYRLAPASSAWVLSTGSSLGVQGIARLAGGTMCAGATSAGLALSTDNGATWVDTTGASTFGFSRGLWVGPGEDIHIATNGGAAHTTNRGTTWTSMAPPVTSMNQLQDISGAKDGTLLVLGTDAGVLLYQPLLPTSITIKTTATSVRTGAIPILSGVVTPVGMIGKNIVVWVKKPGKAYFSYSSNRTVYNLGGKAAWQYKYTFKRGMVKGYYVFKAVVPGYPTFLTSTSPTTVTIRLR